MPFLNMGQCVVDELKMAALKPLEAGTCAKIGVLATGSALTEAFYKEKVHDLVKSTKLLSFFFVVKIGF